MNELRPNPKIVIAGYGSWAKASANPAARIVARLQTREWTDIDVVAVEIPVNAAELSGRIDTLLQEVRPDAWIGLGVAPSSTLIRAEMVGINWLHAEVPDSTGAQFDQLRIVPQGPAAYDATLPNAKIVTAIRAAEVPAHLSFSAGTHLCNHMLYTTGHLIQKLGLNTRFGFIHLPYAMDDHLSPDQDGDIHPSMPLDLMITAVTTAVYCVADEMAQADSDG